MSGAVVVSSLSKFTRRKKRKKPVHLFEPKKLNRMSRVFGSLLNNPHCWRIGRKPQKINSQDTRKKEWGRFYWKNLMVLFLLIAFQNHSRAKGSLLKFSRTQCRLNCKAGKRRSCKNKDKFKDFIQRPEGAFFKKYKFL